MRRVMVTKENRQPLLDNVGITEADISRHIKSYTSDCKFFIRQDDCVRMCPFKDTGASKSKTRDCTYGRDVCPMYRLSVNDHDLYVYEDYLIPVRMEDI